MAVTGTFNGASIVALPTSPGFESVEFNSTDAVAIVTSPFTGQTQAQQWMGADSCSGTVTLPPLTQAQADDWIAFLMECRGMANCFFLGDPLKSKPRGITKQGDIPIVAFSASAIVAGSNIAGSQILSTQSWTGNQFGVLLPNDSIQVGNRLHKVMDRVNSDANGFAAISIWPSLREAPALSTPLILNHAKGLFRLGTNKRTWSADSTFLTRISFPITEYR